MKKIAFIISRDKFTDGLISWFETFYLDQYEFVFYTNKRDGRFPLSEHKCPIIEVDYFRDTFKIPHVDSLLSADAVIISGFFYNPPKHIKKEQELLDKMWIDFWGGDYTCFRLRYIKDGIYMYLERYKKRMKFIRNCRGWILEVRGDYDEIKRHSFKKKTAIVAPVLTPADIEPKELYITKNRSKDDTVVILLGNSGYRENDHIPILKRLSHLRNEDIKIICPLSYGDLEYSDRVRKIGEKIYGDKFEAIVDFMPKEQYFDMLKNIDIAIFNNNRQQGMGNIEEMLRQGKKVYLRTSTPMWSWYLERGQIIFDTKSLKGISVGDLVCFSKEDAENNLLADQKLRETQWAVKQWQKVLDIATN